MNLHELNHLPPEERSEVLFRCCGSRNWVARMESVFPVEDYVDLSEDAEEKWYECSEADWKQAFSHEPELNGNNERAGHPRFSADELTRLSEATRAYEDRFGYRFIACGPGKSAGELLQMIEQRLQNDPGEEIKVAADQQMQITRLRLEELLELNYQA